MNSIPIYAQGATGATGATGAAGATGATGAAGNTNVTTVMKTADESIQSDITVNNDADLVIAIAANKVYMVEIVVFFNAPVVQGFRWNTAATATTTGEKNTGNLSGGTPPTHKAWQGGSDGTPTADATDQCIYLWGILNVGGTGGSLTFQWAQAVSGAFNTTLKKGSSIRLTILN